MGASAVEFFFQVLQEEEKHSRFLTLAVNAFVYHLGVFGWSGNLVSDHSLQVRGRESS